ncbi:ribosome recycling factor [Candidatus Gottesmanbacteria bacterium RIFCSPHIGHO2_01_FULL_42_12]|uniref:Ribosome-recycling factor n=1 Tax=Candidatus Gottesmanbacteria bacterium RIFCSPHIGHO2_01_FULL_42_12 TaxID=1798377 RepID=A0A1F5Z5H5_9BACT|nr:MAG: ribosome recycling factor [Candidatus Gottesmanbacteria bacterium RIFCSPHIGHO2_01_FULL_42_12]
MDEIIITAKSEMTKAIDVIRVDLSTIRTGRAIPSLIEHLLVEAYGSKMKLVELASITAPDPQTLIVTPFDPGNAIAILKAIEESGMGFTPGINENIVRVVIPPLSQERREEFVKLVHTKLEGGKVMVRQVRHKYMDTIKDADNDEDTKKRLEKELQETTDKIIAELDLLGKKKVEELLTV